MTDQIRLPCRDEGANPDDWFITREGKQYSADDVIAPEDMLALVDEWDPNHEKPAEDRDAFAAAAEREAKSAALIQRRKARDLCHTDCLFRTRCLDMALTDGHEHGTWGGYYEEQIRAIRKAIAEREN